MTTSTSPLMPDQLINCMANGRDPTIQEMSDIAERIWTDGAAGRSAFSWADLPPKSDDRLAAFRGAKLALVGRH